MIYLTAGQFMGYSPDFGEALLSYRFSTSETLLAICLTSLLCMYLMLRSGKYSPLTRFVMDILTAISISSGIVVVLMYVFA